MCWTCRAPRRNMKYVTRNLVLKRDHFGDIDLSLYGFSYCNECYKYCAVDNGIDY